jgi:hypothetical protein
VERAVTLTEYRTTLDAQVAALHAEGLGHRAIAERIGVTPHAVRTSITRQGLTPRPPGRPDEGRVHAVIVRLTAEELAAVDVARGGRPRAEWVREAALRAARGGGP